MSGGRVENMSNIENAVKSNLLKAANILGKQIDAEIEKLDHMDEETLQKLREERLYKLKQETHMKKEWLSLGHGKYEELPEEAEFFVTIKKSKNVIIHFYRHETPRCKIFDHHLKILAPKHIETRMVKLDAEKCPFLVERLKVRIIPTILISVDGKLKDRIIGFTDLGNKDDFSTDVLEWRLAHSNVIEYDGDLLTPPDQKKKNKSTIRKTIRDSFARDDSDSEISD